jgi:ankyrin repeat protein/signal recognition particle receptor subunit beta
MSTADDSLYWACFHGYKHRILELANKNNVNYVHPPIGDTPLHQACKQGWLDIVEILIDKYDCDLKVVTKCDESLLHYACQYGRISIVKLLIQKYGCDPNVVTKSEESLLHYACQYDHIIIVKLLIERHSCDPNVVTKNNQNLLHYACRCGKIDIIKYLINKQHLNPLMRDNIDQLEPLDYALYHDRHYIAVYICQHCISSDETLNPNRIKTTINLIKYIILRADIWDEDSWKTSNGDNILQLVFSSKTCVAYMPSAVVSEIVCSQNLIAYLKPDLRTADGDTILQIILRSISRISSSVLVKLLSDSREISINEMRSINPNWKTVDRAHFPHVLCLSTIENNKVIELMQYYILENGWNPDTSDSEGNAVLHIACQTDKLSLVSYLIDQAQCNPNIENSKGNFPVDMTKSLEVITHICQHDRVTLSSQTIIKWLNNPMFDNTTMFCILVNNHKTITKDGSTLLHLVCTCTSRDKISLIDYLLIECQCDPNCMDSKGQMPLQLTSDSRIMNSLIEYGAKMTTDVVFQIIKMQIPESTIIELLALSSRKGTMLWNPTDVNRYGKTAFEVADTLNKPIVVDYLLTDAKNHPSALYLFNSLLKLTRNLNVAKSLIKHGARAIPELVLRFVAMESEPKKHSLIKLLLTTWNPDDSDSDGYTALHLACKADRPTTVKILLSVAHCDPNIETKNKAVPIQLTSDLGIMKILIEHGAQMTTDVIFKLISMHSMDSRVSELFKFSTTNRTTLRNPNDFNNYGYTVLHFACQTDSFTIVHYLLSVAHCDPNTKSSSEEVPLQMTTNPEIIKDLIRYGARTSIMYKSYKKALGTDKPLQPPVKVFVVGNPSVGKSTLTAALKTERGIIARFFSLGKVSEVEEKTVGIVPHDFESGCFGRVTLYDFAGHREFYSGHAAPLQTAIQSTPPIFLLVVNISEDDNQIITNILYWVSFLENQCASITCRPHIILIGSHTDALKGVNPKEKVKAIISTLDTKYFTNMEYIGFVAMNCRLHESTGMSDLRRLLIKSCQDLRIREPITFNAHCFFIYLNNKFINVAPVSIKTVSDTINDQQSKEGVLEFLPTDFDALYKICLELNDRGHILLLKNRTTVENSYIIIDKEFLLSKISGIVIAPEGFKQYKDFSSNTGVVPLSKIAHCFPDSDINILIGFLTHLEFCHEISDQVLLYIANDRSQVKERYYLFPGLISVKAESNIWETKSHFNVHFGWTLQCTNLEQFLTPQFLQVLLLKLAFSLTLESNYHGSDVIGINRNCSIWKNGIFWGREFGIEILVEIIEQKSVIVITQFQTLNLEKCLTFRSEVIHTVLECLNKFCPRVSVAESFIDASSPLRYPFCLNLDKTFCTVQALAETIVSNEPSIVLSDSERIIPAERFLSFEPYTEIELSTLQELWDENNENKIMSDNFILKFVRNVSSKLNWFAKLFRDSAKVPGSKDDLYHELLTWKDNKMTYKAFRQKLDKYSVFAGRNVLVSITKLTHFIMYIIYHNNRILQDISMNHHHQMKEKRHHKLKTKIF